MHVIQEPVKGNNTELCEPCCHHSEISHHRLPLLPTPKLSFGVEKLRLKMIKHQLSHNDLRSVQSDDLERIICS